MSTTTSQTMLKRVATRLQLASFGQRFYLFVLIVSGVYAALLLLARFTGIPEGLEFAPLSLFVIPACGLVMSAIWHRRPTPADAARHVDKTAGTKDLFLTYAMLEDSVGEYKPLVQEDAERRAKRVDPEQVVQWNWGPRVGRAMAVVAGLFLAVMYLPQFDPFGKVAAAEESRQKLAQMDKDRQATQLRMAEIKKQDETAKSADEVDKAINDLTTSFGQMNKDQQQDNRKSLNEHQKLIGQKWRKLGSEKLRTLLSQNSPFQDFGGERMQKLRKWSDELMDGSSEELNMELRDMEEMLREMLQETDPLKRSEMAKDLKERMRDLEEFASENVGSAELSAALRRAIRQMEQLEEGKSPAEAKQAMEALAESLDLTKMELQQIQQAAQDMKKLEEALETIQKAKELNEQSKLDAEGTGEFQSLSDYAELYEQLMGEGDGDGEGTGGAGFGEGGEVPEDESTDSKFKEEREKVATRAGKILLSIQGKGMSEAGEAKKEYRQLIEQVQQGANEALLQEQIPPGYHDSIRGYFDSIDGKSDESQP